MRSRAFWAARGRCRQEGRESTIKSAPSPNKKVADLFDPMYACIVETPDDHPNSERQKMTGRYSIISTLITMLIISGSQLHAQEKRLTSYQVANRILAFHDTYQEAISELRDIPNAARLAPLVGVEYETRNEIGLPKSHRRAGGENIP